MIAHGSTAASGWDRWKRDAGSVALWPRPASPVQRLPGALTVYLKEAGTSPSKTFIRSVCSQSRLYSVSLNDSFSEIISIQL